MVSLNFVTSVTFYNSQDIFIFYTNFYILHLLLSMIKYIKYLVLPKKSIPPFSAQKALKAVNVSQMIEGYKPVDKKELKDQVKKILSHK